MIASELQTLQRVMAIVRAKVAGSILMDGWRNNGLALVHGQCMNGVRAKEQRLTFEGEWDA